jgi:hypothetical protein
MSRALTEPVGRADLSDEELPIMQPIALPVAPVPPGNSSAPLIHITAADLAAWEAARAAYRAAPSAAGREAAAYKIAEYVADLKAEALAHDRDKLALYGLVTEACHHLRGPAVLYAKQIHVYARETRHELESLRLEVANLGSALARAKGIA